MLPPHGGRLVDRLTPEEDRARYREEASELLDVPVSLEARKDYESISYGLFSPLEGPMTANDYSSVLVNGRLENGVPWTFPIVLDVTAKVAAKISEGDDVVLSHSGKRFAILHVEDKYPLDKRIHAEKIFNTVEVEHPGVSRTMEMGDMLLGGSINLFEDTPGKFPRYRLKPKETRFLFNEMGWRSRRRKGTSRMR
jgi:sulfate adenylyltransferase